MLVAVAFLSSWLMVGGSGPLHAWTIQSETGNQYGVGIEYREDRGERSMMEETSYDVPASDFSKTFDGLTTDQLGSSAGMHVHFRIKRDAGWLDCDGWAHNGNASGDFTITPDPAFSAELEKRGIGKPTPEQQTLLMFEGGGSVYDLLNALRDGGFGHPSSVDQLINLYNHGIRADYVKAVQPYAKGRSIDDLISARDHGITARYITSLQSSGYTSLSLNDMVGARDHGVSQTFIKGLSDAGYKNLSMDEMVRLRDHGVSPDYIHELNQLGYHPTTDELVELRDHGVNARYVQYLSKHGFSHLSVADLIRMRDHGI